MAREVWPTGEIEVGVSGAFTTRHHLRTETGTLGELTLPAFRTGGVFRAGDGRELTVHRTSWWRGWHELREDETLLGTARPRGFWRRQMVVHLGVQEYVLQPAGFWTRSYSLVDAVGRTLLEIRPRGVFRRGAYLAVMAPVDVDLLIFAYYLVHTRWQEDAAAAGAASSAGAAAAS
jgi:hypothetical protein